MNIFDGKKFAEKKEFALEKKVHKLRSQKIFPKLASILIGNDSASGMYVNMKKKRGEKIGIKVDIYKFSKSSKKEEVVELIKKLNGDNKVHGIMIQFPIQGFLSRYKNEFVEMIDSEKDVDGLKSDSPYLHPTSKAVYEIIKFAEQEMGKKFNSVAIVGATGMVGHPLTKVLEDNGYNIVKCNSKTKDLEKKTKLADVVISVTGRVGLITDKHVKNGAVVIDVGSPKGDVDFEAIKEISSFITSVPGGVGPVTISCLLENILS